VSQPAPKSVSLFVTCVVDQFFPEVGESTVRVLRRHGVDVEFDPNQTCCGQPAFNTGYWKEARPLAERFLDMYEGRDYVVLPSGSCASMVRVFYKELFHDDPALLRRASDVGNHVFELSEFLVDILGADGPPEPSPSDTVQCVTYHEACHLRRELGATTQARKLINQTPDVELVEMEQSEVCCGFGGTFAVKYADISGAMLDEKLTHISNSGAAAVVACDVTCLMHIGGGLEKQDIPVRPMHLAELLDKGTS
jgi:L-lactate dehydrogenase complex protein LldE